MDGVDEYQVGVADGYTDGFVEGSKTYGAQCPLPAEGSSAEAGDTHRSGDDDAGNGDSTDKPKKDVLDREPGEDDDKEEDGDASPED